MAMRCQDVTVVGFLDSLRNRIYIFASFLWIAIPADDPSDVVESAITLADVPPPVPRFLNTICLEFFDPPFICADVAKVDRRKKYLDSLLCRFTNHPIRVFEVFFIRRRKITRRDEWTFSVSIHRATKLVLNQVDDD